MKICSGKERDVYNQAICPENNRNYGKYGEKQWLGKKTGFWWTMCKNRQRDKQKCECTRERDIEKDGVYK